MVVMGGLEPPTPVLGFKAKKTLKDMSKTSF